MKIGRFVVSSFFTNISSPGFSYKKLAAVTDGLAVVRCEYRLDMDGLEYVALGEPFDDVSQGDLPPLYTVMVETRMGKPDLITFKRAG